MLSKKATEIDEIFTADLTLTTECKIDGEDFVNFLAFLENMNFTYLQCTLKRCLVSRWLDIRWYS